jgi:hypothetical protein
MKFFLLYHNQRFNNVYFLKINIKKKKKIIKNNRKGKLYNIDIFFKKEGELIFLLINDDHDVNIYKKNLKVLI